MDSVGLVVSSEGSGCEIQVTSEKVEVGSILSIGESFGIVASMRYRQDDTVGGKQKLTAYVQIFGERSESGIKSIKRPIVPYTKAYHASEKELESMLHCMDEISIGCIHGTNARAILDGSEYDRHTAILASTGAGKSYLAANLIKEYSMKGLPVLVVDTHGEFPKLLSMIKTDKPLEVDVYTVGRKKQGYKSFTVPVSSLTCSDFTHFTSINENQINALDMILNKVYHEHGEEYGIDDIVAACEQVSQQAATGKAKVHEETAKALERKMRSLKSRYKNIFSLDGTDLNAVIQPYQVAVIDTSLSTQGIRQSVVSYICKRILEGRVNKTHTLDGFQVDYEVLLVVEEAHNYAGSNFGHSCKWQLQRIASEGRKFGVGLLVVSQKPSKIDEEILSQCNTGMYMHITNPRDKDHIRRSFERISDEVVKELDSLDVGECIIAGAQVKLPFLLVKADHIDVPTKKESKLRFERKRKVKTQKFDYI